MRTAALFLSFVAFGYAAKAQKFTLVPQVGFENSTTKILYNNQNSFSPAGVVFSPQAALQLNYRMRSGHGFYLGAASSRSTVAFSFSDPETGMNNYKATTGDMQLRWEGGYQFSSKPLYFKKQSSTKAQPSPGSNIAEKKTGSSSSYRSYCIKSKTPESRPAPAEKAKQAKEKGTWVKLQPSVGMGFVPRTLTDVVTKPENGQTAYVYNAGNWNTALMTGMNFEFGKNSSRLFTIGFNYIKGLGNLNTQTISSVVGSKTMITQLSSEVSGWNMRIGVPFTVGAKKPVVKAQPAKVDKPKSACSQYRVLYKCGKTL